MSLQRSSFSRRKPRSPKAICIFILIPSYYKVKFVCLIHLLTLANNRFSVTLYGHAVVVQWIELVTPNDPMQVRFLPMAHIQKNSKTLEFFCICAIEQVLGELGVGPKRKTGARRCEVHQENFSVSSDGYLSARSEDDGLRHVEKIF
jgi:hypothetical protein